MRFKFLVFDDFGVPRYRDTISSVSSTTTSRAYVTVGHLADSEHPTLSHHFTLGHHLTLSHGHGQCKCHCQSDDLERSQLPTVKWPGSGPGTVTASDSESLSLRVLKLVTLSDRIPGRMPCSTSTRDVLILPETTTYGTAPVTGVTVTSLITGLDH
eukprot:3342917-Rhodomonas_salina.2